MRSLHFPARPLISFSSFISLGHVFPVRRFSGGGGRLFDRILPEDPPELKAYKARESRLIREQVGRSKFMDAHRAMGADKVRSLQ